jgi:hypothetical protein
MLLKASLPPRQSKDKTSAMNMLDTIALSGNGVPRIVVTLQKNAGNGRPSSLLRVSYLNDRSR